MSDTGVGDTGVGDTGVVDIWERHAAWWQRGYTEGADPEYDEQILPLAAGLLTGRSRILDIGCGEGQIARRAVGVGADFVVGLDRAWNQLSAARDRAGGPDYVRGDASVLPFVTATFDAVVACLVLEHLERFEDACAEVARVLQPGGRFVLLCNHPFTQTIDSGWIDDQILDPPEQYWRVGPYLTEGQSLVEVDHGVSIVFHHRPLSRYVNALADVGLTVEHMIEPAPPPGFMALAPEYEAIATIPRLLVLVTSRS